MVLTAVLTLTSTLAAEQGFAQALEQAKKGAWSEPAMVEVNGFSQGSFRSFKFFGSGVGIREGREQVALDKKLLTKVFRELQKARFGEMPEQFGGKPRPTNGPEMRSLIRVRLGRWEKTVVQMRDGEQSRDFARLVEKLLKLGQQAPPGVTAPQGWEGLRWLLEGKLAPETLALELALETAPKRFFTLTVQDGWYTLAAGDGQVEQGWLSGPKLQQLAKILLPLEGADANVRLALDHQINLRATVLGRSVQVVGMRWAGTPPGTSAGREEIWRRVEENLKVFAKELRLPPEG